MRQWVSRCSDSTAYTVLPLTACVRPAQGDCTAYSGEGRNGRATSTNQDLASQNGILLQAAPLCAVRYQHVHRITHTGRRGPVCKRTICWFFFFCTLILLLSPTDRFLLACTWVCCAVCRSQYRERLAQILINFRYRIFPSNLKIAFVIAIKENQKRIRLWKDHAIKCELIILVNNLIQHQACLQSVTGNGRSWGLDTQGYNSTAWDKWGQEQPAINYLASSSCNLSLKDCCFSALLL